MPLRMFSWSIAFFGPTMSSSKIMTLNVDPILDFDIPWEDRQAYIQQVMRGRKFSLLGSGRHRSAYVNPKRTCVLKFPRNIEGLSANRFEARRYAKYKLTPEPTYGIVYAPCRLLQRSVLLMLFAPIVFGNTDADDSASDAGLLIQKDYYALRDKQQLPKWIGRLDARQAGILRSGRIVAY